MRCQEELYAPRMKRRGEKGAKWERVREPRSLAGRRVKGKYGSR